MPPLVQPKISIPGTGEEVEGGRGNFVVRVQVFLRLEEPKERRGGEEEWKWISIVIRSDRSRGKRTSLGYQPTNSFATVLHTLTNRGNNENNFSPSFSPLNDSHCALVPAPDFFGCRAARNGGGGGGSLPCPAEIGERRVASLGYCVYVSGMTVRLSARN